MTEQNESYPTAQELQRRATRAEHVRVANELLHTRETIVGTLQTLRTSGRPVVAEYVVLACDVLAESVDALRNDAELDESVERVLTGALARMRNACYRIGGMGGVSLSDIDATVDAAEQKL